MTATDRQSIPGQDIMLERRRALLAAGATRVGWKLGREIAWAGDRVVLGALTSATVVPDGGIYVAGHPIALRAETELLIEVGDDVAAEASPDDVRAAIAGVGLALELVDVGDPHSDLEQVVAGDVFHRAVVLGIGRCPAEAASADATLAVAGRVHRPDRPLPDLVQAVRDAAELLERGGERLLAGDLLLTGSLVHVPVGRGDEVVAEIAGLGRVSVSIDP
jgi:2-keto-4-pentenoate hydratase